MLTRRRIVVGRVEAVEGTMEAITVADAGVLAIDPKFEPDFKTFDRSNVSLASISPLQPLMGARSVKISFKAEVKGAGVAYSATIKPALGVYLRACGFAETIVTTAGNESATYVPASSGIPSLTIWIYEDGIIKKARGCRGSVKFSGKLGEPIYAEFTFTGVYDSTVDGAFITPTYEATVPPVLMNTVLSLDGNSSLVAESFSVDMSNDIQLRPNLSSTDGYTSALLVDRKTNGTLDPEMVTVATYDFMGKWKAGNAAALTIGPVGPTGVYNKFTFTAPKVVYTKVGESDRNSNMVADLGFTLAMNTGDDELSLAFVK